LFVLLRPTVEVPVPSPAAILVHPGSGSPRKNWPRERWLAVLSELPRPVTVVLGEAEMTSWPAALPPDVSLLTNAPLETLVAHLARCRLFLGHDSGISHLAAACGAPCLLLFGPTDPAIWAPPAPRVRVIRREADLNSISLAVVQQTLTTMLAETR
jgi:ADP-heptose:LPS heptosyltransferase